MTTIFTTEETEEEEVMGVPVQMNLRVLRVLRGNELVTGCF
jgi:hypothetical protein